MTIKEALTEAINLLKKSNIENPIQASKIVLASVLEKDKEYLLIYENEGLSDEKYKEFIEKIQKISNGTPIQYVTNNQEFMKMNFFVDENVLIPRPDTEILIEEVLKLIDKKEDLLIFDISNKALEIAKKNAIKNGVEKKIDFICSNMFEKLDSNNKFDIIISNPPYIETDIIPTLQKEVQKEPILALDGGKDGLDFYRNILINSKKYLKKNGTICLEIGYNQKESVMNLFKSEYKNIYCKKDLSGNDRVIVANNE